MTASHRLQLYAFEDGRIHGHCQKRHCRYSYDTTTQAVADILTEGHLHRNKENE